MIRSERVDAERALLPDLATAAIAELVTGLPHLVASVKDVQGRYLHATAAFAELVGRRSGSDVIGLTVRDLFPEDLAASYEAQDRRVLDTGRPLHDHLEVIEHHDASRRWYVTSKVRVLTMESGRAVASGTASISLDVRAPDAGELHGLHTGLAAVVTYVTEQPGEHRRVDDLAALAGISRTQLDRISRRALGASITHVVHRVRLDHAMHQLSHTETPIADVANACGFYDQSDFTRRFRSAIGMTPAAYRRQHPVRKR